MARLSLRGSRQKPLVSSPQAKADFDCELLEIRWASHDGLCAVALTVEGIGLATRHTRCLERRTHLSHQRQRGHHPDRPTAFRVKVL